MPVISFLIVILVLLAGFVVFCLIVTPLWLLLSDRIFPRMQEDQRTGCGCLLVPISYVIVLIVYASWPPSPERVFEAAFGFHPPPTVNFQYCHEEIFADSGTRILNFSANSSTVDQIVQERFQKSLGGSAPDADGKFRFSREASGDFALESENLVFDPSTGVTVYDWEGID